MMSIQLCVHVLLPGVISQKWLDLVFFKLGTLLRYNWGIKHAKLILVLWENMAIMAIWTFYHRCPNRLFTNFIQ